MDLDRLPIPSRFPEMIQTYETYYHSFYVEMVRMSNANINDYMNRFKTLVNDLSRGPTGADRIRAAIGIVSLHGFGYQDFNGLAQMFDHLLPQVDSECVKFTSWCAGRITHHPNVDQARYAQRLFVRCIGWARSNGRRARLLASAHMLSSLAASAGSRVVVFLPSLRAIIWRLISHPSVHVLRATAQAIAEFTHAIIRYARGELERYCMFFEALADNLLRNGDPNSEYAALLVLESLISSYPAFFASKFKISARQFIANLNSEYLTVQRSAYATLTAFAEVDPVQFVDVAAKYLFKKTEVLINEFPADIVCAIGKLCKIVPAFMETKIEKVKNYAKLIEDEPDCTFTLLTYMLRSFGAKVLPLEDAFVCPLLDQKMTTAYGEFAVALANIEMSEVVAGLLCERIEKGLEGPDPLVALRICADLPACAMSGKRTLLDAIMELRRSDDDVVRREVGRAGYRAAQACKDVQMDDVVIQMMEWVIYDPSIEVRAATLRVIRDNTPHVLASGKHIGLLQICANDDSMRCRTITYQLLGALVKRNPVGVSAITRTALLEAFFTITHIPSIRQKARVVQTLPDLVSASIMTISAFSKAFLDIVMKVITEHSREIKFENFLEEAGYDAFMMGIVKTLALIAPVEPAKVAEYCDTIVPFYCDFLMEGQTRPLVLAVLELLFVLVEANSADPKYRELANGVMVKCSAFLANTQSRKARMACLKVIGAIGVLESGRPKLPESTRAPENVDDALARQFFRPSRDLDEKSDETLLIKKEDDQYFTIFTAGSLMKIFNDDAAKEYYIDVVQALVETLSRPRMYILPYFDSFVVRLLEILETSDDVLTKTLVPHYSKLIANSTHNASPFLERSVKLVRERFCLMLAPEFINLLISFVHAVKDGIARHSAQMICVLFGCLDSAKTSSVSISSGVLNAFGLIGIYASDLLYLIVPQMCDAIECEQTLSNVRIAAFSSLRDLACRVNVFRCLGPIMRSLAFGLGKRHPATHTTAMKLLITMLESYGNMFLANATPILDQVRKNGIGTEKLRRIVAETRKQSGVARFKPTFVQPKAVVVQEVRQHIFSEDAVVNRAVTPNSEMSKHFEEWLRGLILSVIAHSPCGAIRACSSLATAHYPLAAELFNPAFYSCWKQLTETGRSQILRSFQELLNVSGNLETVAREVLNLFAFMHRIQQPLNIPIQDVSKACRRYGYPQLALRLQEDIIAVEHDNASAMQAVINIYIQLGEWENAIGVWERCHQNVIIPSAAGRVEILESLGMWDQVEEAHKRKFNATHDFEAFCGLVRSLNAMAMWNDVMNHLDMFRDLQLHQKRIVAQHFAEAALHLDQWDVLDECLKYSPDDSIRCTVMTALNALHKDEWNTACESVDHGFSLLASRPITFWTDNQTIHRTTMRECQELVEVLEMHQHLRGLNVKTLEDGWSVRLRAVPRDFNLWFRIVSNRAALTEVRDENLIKFFQLKSLTMGTKVHTHAFSSLFPGFELERAPDLHKVCWVVAKWNTGETKEALHHMEQLSKEITGRLGRICHMFLANWLMETDESFPGLKKAFSHLQTVVAAGQGEQRRSLVDADEPRVVLNTERRVRFSGSALGSLQPITRELVGDITDIQVLRKWSDVNIELMSRDTSNTHTYVTNAIDALSRCIEIAPSFPDVVQLMNLFFEHANQAPETLDVVSRFRIESLHPKMLLEASPQILVQLNHQVPKLANVVRDVVFKLLLEHYHELIFSVIVLTKSKNSGRAKAASDILDMFRAERADVYEEVHLIRRCLLRATVTWYEKTLQRIGDACEHFQRGKMEEMVNTLKSVVEMVRKERNYTCELHEKFKSQFKGDIEQLAQKLQIYSARPVTQTLNEISRWCGNMDASIGNAQKQIRAIQLSAISPELCEKTGFKLAVPGTYEAGVPPICIEYFVGQFTVYASKQHPKDVIVKGEDGNFYQYLLKGHEDLRLDERIMQFFSVINSFVAKGICFKHNFIRTVTVIPFSMHDGLVQWVPGTATLRELVEKMRKLRGRDPLEEFTRANQYSAAGYDGMQPFQKKQIMEMVFNAVPDTDIADFFWQKAENAELWLKHVNSFAISVAMTSIVGYVVGLGDRHPGNLLLDRFTGTVVHIDFGDCFEKASRRVVLPEVVPFRLTRMMVRAFGASGVDGLFRASFINMSTLLRDNRRVLNMVLAVFVQEPLIDPEDSVRARSRGLPSIAHLGSVFDTGQAYVQETGKGNASSVEMRRQVQQKLMGTDLEDGVTLSVADQATRLIEMATDSYSLSKMYSGWCPYW